jgi:DNA-directed RNA polymerase specialized sigma subunit
MRKKKTDLVIEAYNNLSSINKNIIYNRLIKNKSFPSIAKEMNKSQTAVRARFSLSIKKLDV